MKAVLWLGITFLTQMTTKLQMQSPTLTGPPVRGASNTSPMLLILSKR